MLGDLSTFPFLAEVWGTAAAWFGAIGTTSAFLLAAFAYRRDVKLRRYEQAVMVRIHEKSNPIYGLGAANSENLVLEVHNTSDKYIYSISGSLIRTSLFKIVADSMGGAATDKYEKPSGEELDEKLKRYRGVKEDFGFGNMIDRLKPGGIEVLRFSVPFTVDHELRVTFMDAQNQAWGIVDDRHFELNGKAKPRLVFIGKRFIRLVRLSNAISLIFNPPLRTVRYYGGKAKLRIWAIRNAAWGPGVKGWTQNTDYPAVDVPPEGPSGDVGGENVPDRDSSQDGPDLR